MKDLGKLGDFGRTRELSEVYERLVKELGRTQAYHFFISSATLILYKEGLRGEKIVKIINRTLKVNKENLEREI